MTYDLDKSFLGLTSDAEKLKFGRDISPLTFLKSLKVLLRAELTGGLNNRGVQPVFKIQ